MCCHFIFHSGSSKRNFCCKEHSCKSKIVKVSNFPPLFTRFLLSFFLSLYSNDMTPKQKFQIFSPLFVCLLSWTHIWHIFLQSPCIRTIWHRFQETWKNTCFPSFFKFSLFVKLDTCLAYLSQVSLYSNDMTKNEKEPNNCWPKYTQVKLAQSIRAREHYSSSKIDRDSYFN